MKPQDHRNACTIKQETSYEVALGAIKGSHASSGTLQCGRVVWTQKNPRDYAAGEKASAYADGIGVIAVDPGCLASIVTYS